MSQSMHLIPIICLTLTVTQLTHKKVRYYLTIHVLLPCKSHEMCFVSKCTCTVEPVLSCFDYVGMIKSIASALNNI